VAVATALLTAGAVGLAKTRRERRWALAMESGLAQTTSKAGSGTATGRPGDPMGPVLELQQFLIQLAPREAERYVRFSLALEMRDEATREAGLRRMSRIRAAILETMTDFTADNLHGRRGVERLKENIRARLRRLLGDGLKSVYLVQFGVV
jgi:flagellar protein FliL